MEQSEEVQWGWSAVSSAQLEKHGLISFVRGQAAMPTESFKASRPQTRKQRQSAGESLTPKLPL